MNRIEFKPFPGTKGYISPNGVELVLTAGDFDEIRKFCTVTNKSIIFQLRNAKRAIARWEAKITKLNEELGEGSRQALKLEDLVATKHKEVAELTPKIKTEYWADKEDGTLSLPAGFWWMCESIKNNAHLNTEVEYKELPVVDGKKPRAFQEEGVKALLKYKRASLVAATGLGKSMVSMMLAHSLISAGKRVCIIVPTIELCEQTLKIAKKYFKKASALGGKNKFKEGSEIVVTTVDSALKCIDMFDAIVVDEMHHSSSSSYSETLFLAMSAKYFYGLTACPVRADGMTLGIHAACGPVVYEKNIKWGIDNKFLTPYRVVVIEIGGIGKWDKNASHASVYRDAMKNPKVVKAILDMIANGEKKKKKTLVLYKTVGAGEAASQTAKARGFGPQFEVASAQYRKPLTDFRDNKTDLLVSNAPLCGEGVDLPDVSMVLSCCQMASENMTRQILGRGLRLAPGKTETVYVEIVTKGFEPFERAAAAREKILREASSDFRYVRL